MTITGARGVADLRDDVGAARRAVDELDGARCAAASRRRNSAGRRGPRGPNLEDFRAAKVSSERDHARGRRNWRRTCAKPPRRRSCRNRPRASATARRARRRRSGPAAAKRRASSCNNFKRPSQPCPLTRTGIRPVEHERRAVHDEVLVDGRGVRQPRRPRAARVALAADRPASRRAPISRIHTCVARPCKALRAGGAGPTRGPCANRLPLRSYQALVDNRFG